MSKLIRVHDDFDLFARKMQKKFRESIDPNITFTETTKLLSFMDMKVPNIKKKRKRKPPLHEMAIFTKF